MPTDHEHLNQTPLDLPPGQALLDASYDHFHTSAGPVPLRDNWQQYFYAFPASNQDSRSVARRLQSHLPASIEAIGPARTLQSYTNPGQTVTAFPVFPANPSKKGASASDHLFFHENCNTLLHDVPRRHLALADAAARLGAWPLDTKGKPVTLRVLCYDIEKTRYKTMGDQAPVDIIAWSSFNVTFTSTANLAEERFHFEVNDIDDNWATADITTRVIRTTRERIHALEELVDATQGHDVIAGHNVLAFDNVNIDQAIKEALADHANGVIPLDDAVATKFQVFRRDYTWSEKAFNRGKMERRVHFAPTTADTLLLAMGIYAGRESYTLKALAKDLGIHVANRQYVAYEDLDLDDPRTIQYAEDDVREQLGLTQHLLPLALNQAFVTGLPLTDAFDGSTTTVWDHMAFIRSRHRDTLFPAKCQPNRTLAALTQLSVQGDRARVAEYLRVIGPTRLTRMDLPYDLVRVVKQGSEAPEWVEYADALYDAKTQQPLIEFPGGMTLKPSDPEVDSINIPWYDLHIADVGAMYPGLLRALNANSDTVRLARRDEKPDAWTLVYDIGLSLRGGAYHVRAPDPDTEAFAAGKGFMVGLRVAKEPGLCASAMGGILDLSRRTKHDIEAEWNREDPDMDRVKVLKSQYASIKPLRNSGTHGILSSFSTSCRQFNPWAGAWIPSTGQECMHDAVVSMRDAGMRIVYTDTDGLYIGGAKATAAVPELAAALGIPPSTDGVLASKTEVIDLLAAFNAKWQKRLGYSDFELEYEAHAAAYFHSHKNYVLIDVKQGSPVVTVKGTNFKGRDKPQAALDLLSDVVRDALLHPDGWATEHEGRSQFMQRLADGIQEASRTVAVDQLPLSDLTMNVQVRPASQYKPAHDGSQSKAALLSEAITKLTGHEGTKRYDFVTLRSPLPGITNAKKTAAKPGDFGWPVEHADKNDIDLEWYTNLLTDYMTKRLIGSPKSKPVAAEVLGQQSMLNAWLAGAK